jgi:hypothetical protein
VDSKGERALSAKIRATVSKTVKFCPENLLTIDGSSSRRTNFVICVSEMITQQITALSKGATSMGVTSHTQGIFIPSQKELEVRKSTMKSPAKVKIKKLCQLKNLEWVIGQPFYKAASAGP